MKILYMLHNDPRRAGGTEKHVLQLAESLSGRHEIAIFYPEAVKQEIEPSLEIEDFNGIRLHVLHKQGRNDFLPPGYDVKQQNELLQSLIVGFGPDVIHLHHLKNLPLIALPAAMLSTARSVVSLNDFCFFCMQNHLTRRDDEFCESSGGGDNCAMYCLPRGKRLLSQLSRHFSAITGETAVFNYLRGSIQNRKTAFAKFDAVLAPSQYVLDRFNAEGFESPAARVLEPGIAQFPKNENRATPGRPVRFVSLGNINRDKGAELLIEAFKRISPEDATLAFHGNIVEKSIEKTIGAAVRTCPHITHAGPYQENELPGILAGADCLINASMLPETFSLVISEAWMAGLPVIASAHGAPASRITAGKNGLLFEKGNSADLLAKIETVIDRPELLDEMRNGIPEVMTVDSYIEEIEKIYSGSEG